MAEPKPKGSLSYMPPREEFTTEQLENLTDSELMEVLERCRYAVTDDGFTEGKGEMEIDEDSYDMRILTTAVVRKRIEKMIRDEQRKIIEKISAYKSEHSKKNIFPGP